MFKLKLQKKIFALALVVSMFYIATVSTPTAHAIPVIDGANLGTNIWNGVTQTWTSLTSSIGSLGSTGSWTQGLLEWATSNGAAIALSAAKILALKGVQIAVVAMIGEGDGQIIRDYNDYLYVNPQQQAMARMNSFFNTVSRGRSSTLNYEGVGPNYDAYLIAQARMAISGQPFTTNIQEVATDPKQMFSGGNMKGIMTYMQCANNVACYTMTAQNKYATEFSKAQDVAKSKNVNGFIPKEVNGRIISPALIAQNALSQVDQYGTQLIMTADSGDKGSKLTAALSQVAEGAIIAIAGKAAGYAIADSKGKAAIQNKNDQFAFSVSYNTNNGMSFGTNNGITTNTGFGTIDTSGFKNITKNVITKKP
jgi:hypothetical protein